MSQTSDVQEQMESYMNAYACTETMCMRLGKDEVQSITEVHTSL